MVHALTTRSFWSVKSLTVVVLASWFLLALGGSLLGVFDSEPRPPLPLGLVAVMPIVAFVVCYVTSAKFQQFVSSVDLRLLTVAQTWRVGGTVSSPCICEEPYRAFSPCPRVGGTLRSE